MITPIVCKTLTLMDELKASYPKRDDLHLDIGIAWEARGIFWDLKQAARKAAFSGRVAAKYDTRKGLLSGELHAELKKLLEAEGFTVYFHEDCHRGGWGVLIYGWASWMT